MPVPPPVIEIAAASVEDCLAAEAGGADRIELSGALALGGLTPSIGLVQEVKAVCRLPIVALVRPRSGGFCYSASELAVMLRDLGALATAGADGFAFGALARDGQVDEPACRRLLQHCGGRPAVFHRAFDATPEPGAALERLIALGFVRVLTSGQQPTALEGVENIARFVQQAAGRIEILPAGGVDATTARDLLARTGCNQVHAALRTIRDDGSTAAQPGFTLSPRPPLPANQHEALDPQKVAALRQALHLSLA